MFLVFSSKRRQSFLFSKEFSNKKGFDTEIERERAEEIKLKKSFFQHTQDEEKRNWARKEELK